MEGLAALSGLVSLVAIVLSIAFIIGFFVMAINIESLVKILRRMEMNSMNISSALDKVASQVAPNKMSEADKAKAFDQTK